MKKINVRESEGYELFHDITQILPGKFKGVKFLRGHKIRKEDIDILISLGKENIYVFEEKDKEKNLIASTPVLSELAKVESIVKNDKMEEKYKQNKWEKEEMVSNKNKRFHV